MQQITKRLSIRRKNERDRKQKQKQKPESNSDMNDSSTESEELCWDPESIWTQPVRQLPGPGEHPMLKSLLESVQPNPEFESGKADNTLDTNTSEALPPVYPHVPAPSLAMDDENKTETTSSSRDVDMKSSPTTSSPNTPPLAGPETTTLGSSPTTPAKFPEDSSSVTLNYVRRVKPAESEASHLLHGQVWRGAVEKKKKWRRHQYVVDG
ncbi:hypothetical protein BT63DRAFT_86579 [Microthyrium microscopicum]|uniref:Uncharacterized protein n=1 Tax=Microthyrium microscopicum TaxID=703497 RepID=A0A6A6U0N7_9PEZI|nr:hypothetical protein BT63DRAFT_86579 [Microthyrium microscopicum]